MKAGAIDFLTKPVRDQALLDAVTAGLARDIAQRASAQVARQHVERFAALTARDRQVQRQVALDRLNKQIAFDLGIREITVKLHRSDVMRKIRGFIGRRSHSRLVDAARSCTRPAACLNRSSGFRDAELLKQLRAE